MADLICAMCMRNEKPVPEPAVVIMSGSSLCYRHATDLLRYVESEQLL